MGSEIVYCFKCQTRLLSSDFEKGGAVRFSDRVACVSCASEYMATLPPDELRRVVKAPPPSRPLPLATPRKAQPVVSAPPPPAPRRNPWIVLGIASGAGVLLLIGLLLMLGGKEETTEEKVVGRPAPGEKAPKGPDLPREDPRIQSARDALDRAHLYARRHPEDLKGQAGMFEEAVRKADATPFFREASGAYDAVVEKMRKGPREELARLEQKIHPLVAGQEFKAALDAIEAVRGKYPDAEWASRIQAELKRIRDLARSLLDPLKPRAAEARQAGRAEEEKTIREGIQRWGLADLLAEFDAHLAAVAAPKPLSPEMQAFLPRWREALLRAAGGEFEAAAAEIRRAAPSEELKADAADLLRWGAMQAEALKAAASWPAGRKVAFETIGPQGDPVRIAGTLVRAGPHRGEVAADGGGRTIVEWSDLTAGARAELYRAWKGAPADDDLRVLAVGCLLEGDAETALRMTAGERERVAERFWLFAPDGAARRPRPAAREVEARKLFHEAEREIRRIETLAEAAGKFKVLAAEYADTKLVRAELASIQSRAGAGREYFLAAGELKATGTFRRGKHEKFGSIWTSAADSESSQHNGVEIRFAALPEATYRAWVWAGGCCIETFTIDWQATDLTAPGKPPIACEPGGNSALPLKPFVRNVRATHASHGGPKEPKTWSWIALSLPKYAAPGLKKIRLLTSHKGFSVGAVVVSATRTAPPSEADLRDELAKPRPPVEAVTEGLVGWWKLNEEGGTVAASALEDGPAGTLRGTAAWKGGRLLFDGNQALVEIPATGGLEKVQEKSYTISLWFTPTEVPPGKGDENNSASGLIIRPGYHEGLYYSGEQKFVMEHWIVGNQNRSAGTWNETFPIGKEYHVVGMVETTRAVSRLYIDGQSKAERAFEPNAAGREFGKEPWRIGCGNPGANNWAWPTRGAIRDVRIYGRALEEAEVRELYEAEKEK